MADTDAIVVGAGLSGLVAAAELIAGMQSLTPGTPIDAARVRLEVESRDRQLTNDFAKDAQVTAIRQAQDARRHPDRPRDARAR